MMPFRPQRVALLLFSCVLAQSGSAAEPKPRTVEELAQELKPSIVVITVKGRDSGKFDLGTGFVIDANGGIATNMHVIGDGRLIAVDTADGKKYDVVSILATDRARDLAVIKIDAKNLKALPLGDSDKLKEGQAVVALGNPQGLKHSVVAGVVSGRRDIDGASMLQLAIPIEPGNSGGPVVDMEGRVQGIVTLKSQITDNLGFAVPVNSLKTLIAKPNPISMKAWATIGALDPDEWKPILGANWRQRAGRIKVEGLGTGFGGRSLCLYQPKPPELPYEIAVTVKLDDEKGAAGLAFHCDGERHYGFYPTGGKLRLTRFDGPDVFSWNILREIESPHYRLGDWNTLKVRVSKDGIQSFVNDQLAIESDDATWTSGQAGVAKFRDTAAEFKQFRVANKIEAKVVNAAESAKWLKPFENLPAKAPVPREMIEQLMKHKGSGEALREKARELEQQAARLREAAQQVHQSRVYDELAKELAKPEEKIDLVFAALLLAKLDNEELDVEAYRTEFERLGKKLAAALPKKADDAAKLAALNTFFFEQRGFHGSRSDYYNRSNSYLNEVIDDREGLPITLSILYMELGKRIGLNLAGIGMPGHFVVRHISAKGVGDGPFIDVFERGAAFSLEKAQERIEARGFDFHKEQIEPIAKKAIIVRMLYNFLRVVREENDMEAGLRYLDGIVMFDADALEERFTRSVLLYGKGRKKEALADLQILVDRYPEGKERKRLVEYKEMIEREIGKE
jgi:regulator of sirC expression with transglutaminase-like and TPR domain